MGILQAKSKGVFEIYLTRYYNSQAPFVQNTDDVGFNLSSNPFSDYCFQSTCGSWQNDRIKILSIPDKGKLFRLTNPGQPNTFYVNVTVGDMILVRDMIDHKILKFSGEGFSDNAHTGNYLTQFTFERYCADIPSNIIVTTKLNMIDVQNEFSSEYEILISQTCETTNIEGPTNYDVWCQGSVDFSFSSILNVSAGFVRMNVNGGTAELGLSKQNGSALVLQEVIPITQPLTASLAAAGNNAPSSYPYGGPSSPSPAAYTFEYSLNGFTWLSFQFTLYNA